MSVSIIVEGGVDGVGTVSTIRLRLVPNAPLFFLTVLLASFWVVWSV